MKIKISVLIISCCMAFSSYAKKSKGYVVKQNGDTIQCSISNFTDTKLWYYDQSNTKFTVKANEIIGFSYTNEGVKHVYRSFKPYSQLPVIGISKEDKIFFRQIVSGHISVFGYAFTSHMSYGSGPGYVFEGMTYNYLSVTKGNGELMAIHQENYQSLLISLTEDNKEIKENIANNNNLNSVVSISKEYNEWYNTTKK